MRRWDVFSHFFTKKACTFVSLSIIICFSSFLFVHACTNALVILYYWRTLRMRVYEAVERFFTFFHTKKHIHSYLCQILFVFRHPFFNELVLTFSPSDIIGARRQTACMRRGHCFPGTHLALGWATTRISLSFQPFPLKLSQWVYANVLSICYYCTTTGYPVQSLRLHSYRLLSHGLQTVLLMNLICISIY